MKTLLQALSLLLLLCLNGCLPEERFWWSPDGSRAVVASGDQLYLTTAGGELKEPLSGLKLEGDLPRHASWLPDGSGFVVHRIIKLPTWDEARPLFPPDEAADIERHAAGMPGLLTAALAMSGDGSIEDALMSITPNRDKELMAVAFFCALGKNKAAVESALRDSLKGAEFLAQVGPESGFGIHEICLVRLKNDQVDGEPTPVARSIHPIILPSVSPKHPVIAYWRVLNEEKQVGLTVCTLDGKSRIDVADTNNTTFGWSADGRSLIFAKPVATNEGLLQYIEKTIVLQESGKFVEKIEAVDLAVAIVPEPTRLCVLPDDRVLFAAAPATLPAPVNGLKFEPRLYVISADGKSVNAIPTAPGDLPTNLGFFAASPDGKHVAVVESDTDAVAVVELATGHTDIVSPAHPNWRCRTMPAWKSATELTFAAVDSPEGKPRWMLWNRKAGMRSISEKWSDDATGNWLEKKDTQKSTP